MPSGVFSRLRSVRISRPRAHQQHHAQRHLQRDNDSAGARFARVGIRCGGRSLQRQFRACRQAPRAGRQAKQQRREHQHAQREQQHRSCPAPGSTRSAPIGPAAALPSTAKPHASAPPAVTRITLSVSSCRNNSPRPAPSARRKVNSRCRAAFRAISSITTLVSAISSTSPTIAINMRSGLPYICVIAGKALWHRRRLSTGGFSPCHRRAQSRYKPPSERPAAIAPAPASWSLPGASRANQPQAPPGRIGDVDLAILRRIAPRIQLRPVLQRNPEIGRPACLRRLQSLPPPRPQWSWARRSRTASFPAHPGSRANRRVQ